MCLLKPKCFFALYKYNFVTDVAVLATCKINQIGKTFIAYAEQQAVTFLCDERMNV